MTHNAWTDLGPANGFPVDAHTCLDTEGPDGKRRTALVVLHVGNEWYALENRCPHAGRPLGDGERAGLTLTCPYHGYTYHIRTGKNIDFPDEETPVRTYPIRVEAGRVMVQLADNEADTE